MDRYASRGETSGRLNESKLVARDYCLRDVVVDRSGIHVQPDRRDRSICHRNFCWVSRSTHLGGIDRNVHALVGRSNSEFNGIDGCVRKDLFRRRLIARQPSRNLPNDRNTEMNAISASIIILCATALLIAGSYHPHGQSGLFLQLVAVVMGLFGFAGWLATIGSGKLPGTSTDKTSDRGVKLPSEIET